VADSRGEFDSTNICTHLVSDLAWVDVLLRGTVSSLNLILDHASTHIRAVLSSSVQIDHRILCPVGSQHE
jgi:hypothetical protein